MWSSCSRSLLLEIVWRFTLQKQFIAWHILTYSGQNTAIFRGPANSYIERVERVERGAFIHRSQTYYSVSRMHAKWIASNALEKEWSAAVSLCTVPYSRQGIHKQPHSSFQFSWAVVMNEPFSFEWTLAIACKRFTSAPLFRSFDPQR